MEKMIQKYAGKMQFKSVVASKHDFYYCLEAYELLNKKTELKDSWCITPAYTPGEEFTLELFQNILEMNQKSGSFFKVIGQQHKWVYGADRKQV
jgi:7-carboxy-7-deazaguanine synthase